MTTNTSFSFGSSGGGLSSKIQESVNFGSQTQPSTGGSTGFGTGGFNFGTTGGTSIGGTGFNLGTGGSTGGTTGGFSTGGPTSGGSSGFNFGGGSGLGTSTGSSGFNFGSTGSTGSSAFNFGTNTSTAFGNQPSGPSAFSFNQPSGSSFGLSGFTSMQPQRNPVEVSLQQIMDQYDPKNPSCRFLHWFYNLPREVNNKGEKLPRPLTVDEEKQLLWREWGNIIHQDAWNEAQFVKNPDTKKYYAVPARSFDDVTARVQVQQDRAEIMIQTLKYAASRLDKLRQREMKTQLMIEKVKNEQLRLSLRVLKVQKKLEVLMQRGQPLNNDDVALRNFLQSLLRELHKPSQYRGRLNELKPQLNHYLNQPMCIIDEKIVGDEETLKEMLSFITLQTQGIAQLIDVIKKDSQDVEFIIKQEQLQAQQNQQNPRR